MVCVCVHKTQVTFMRRKNMLYVFYLVMADFISYDHLQLHHADNIIAVFFMAE